jgi:hypothetical protein
MPNMRIEMPEEDLALMIEALHDNAGVFDEGARDENLSSDERQDFARDAERCRMLADRLTKANRNE